MGSRYRSAILALLGITAIIAMACGGTTQPSSASAASASAAPASPASAGKAGELDPQIVANAKSEGKLVFYTSLQTDDSDQIVKAFSKAYPGIKVDLNRKSSSKILSQFMTEAKAGSQLADVLETGGLDIAEPYSKGYVDAFDPPAGADVPKEYHQLGGNFVAARLAIGTFDWNTTQVKPGDEPKSWDDLLDPKWKGKILAEASDFDVLQALGKGRWGGDEAKIRDYLGKLAANKPQLIDGHTEMLSALIAGQGALAWGARGDTTQELIEAQKVPAGWSKSEVMLRLQGAIVAKGAPHPNAARVFVNWYVAKDGGQKALADIGRIPGIVTMAKPVYSGFGKTYVSGPGDASDLSKYEKLWNDLLAKK